MEVPVWVMVISSILSFLGGLLTDLLKRIVPNYLDLVTETKDLRSEVRHRDETISGLEDTVNDMETEMKKLKGCKSEEGIKSERS